jgi:hypothetical protein
VQALVGGVAGLARDLDDRDALLDQQRDEGVPAIYSSALIVITLVICLSALIGPLR